mgnify:CR=1 FL=1
MASNQIIGTITTPSGVQIAVNPKFKMNGDVAVFDFPPSRSATGYITESFTFDWSNTSVDKLPGVETYNIAANTCEIDLNHLSDHNSCPLRYLYISDSSGCTLSVVSGTDELYAAALFAQGLYKAVYSANKKKLIFFKVA